MNKKLDFLLDSTIPNILRFLELYFRVQVIDLSNIPDAPCIVYANHSGFAGLDALMLSYQLKKRTGKSFKMAAHSLWFQQKLTAEIFDKFGMIDANYEVIGEHIKGGNSLIIFPEGEDGNFKPSVEMYHVQPFRSGLVRLALMNQIPVIPCSIIGAEESNINLLNVTISKFFRHGLKIPLPINILPLPTKWKIKFHPPIDTSKYKPEYVENPEIVSRISHLWQKKLQLYIYRELKERDGIFFNRKKWMDRIFN